MSPLNISAMPNQRISSRVVSMLLFVLVLTGSVALVLLRTRTESSRLAYLHQLPEWSVDAPAVDDHSATGYQAEQRRLVVPGHDKQNFDMIIFAQQLLAKGELRVRSIDYENTPLGHPTNVASVYPWLLAGTAAVNHHFTGRPIGQGVEVAAVMLNPGLLLAGLIVLSLLVGRFFNLTSAAVLVVGMAVFFPFTGAFVAGVPSPSGLHALLMLAGLLALFAGIESAGRPLEGGVTSGGGAMRTGICFAGSGVCNALGLWLDVPSALPFIAGIGVAGCGIGLFSRAKFGRVLPWRIWGWVGAATVMIAYIIDYLPARGEGALRSCHPLYALAWVGLAELLVQCGEARSSAFTRRKLLLLGTGLAAMLLLPGVLWYTQTDLFSPDRPDVFKLAANSDIAAPSVAHWLKQAGFSPLAGVTFLPLLLIPLALFGCFRANSNRRGMICLALGPVAAGLLIGTWRLSYWGHIDVALLALLVVLATLVKGHRLRLVVVGVSMVLLIPGLYRAARPGLADGPLSPGEFESYMERDLAHWLRQHAPTRPAVLAPPRVSSALVFYGGFTGLAAFDRDNQAGTAAAIRMVSASSEEEAYLLLTARQLTHIIVPFWDTYLEEYRHLGLGEGASSDRIDHSFLADLQKWRLPPWLRPIPYRLPPGPGIGGAITIFEIVEDQPPALAAAQQVDYFMEMDLLELARARVSELTQYPNDLGALAAICSVATTTHDESALTDARERIFAILAKPERRRLGWDRRVALAIVLAQQKRADLAKLQLAKCLEEIDGPKLRSLTAVSLYRFELLCKIYGMEIADPGLRKLSRDLLRPDLRTRL